MIVRQSVFHVFFFAYVFVSLSSALNAADSPPGVGSKGHYTDMVTPNGGIDWTTGEITAKGLGIPPNNSINVSQRREMTRTAAWSVALRNLLEVVNGIYVDSTTTVNNYMTTSAKVRTHVEGMVRQAKVIKEQELPDGSYEITVTMKLTDFSQTVSPPVEPKTEPIKFKDAPPPPTPTAYTGLVVDARGTGAKAAIAPKLLLSSGEEAYGESYVDKTSGTSQNSEEANRIAWYCETTSVARSHPKVADNPIMIKAIKAVGPNKTDLVIHDADAQLIHLVPGHFDFLKKAKVLIVMDPK